MAWGCGMIPTGRFYPALWRERSSRRALRKLRFGGAFLVLWAAFVAMIMLAMSGFTLVGL